MPLPINVPRREHTGGANPAKLGQSLLAAGMVINGDDLTGWPSGNVGEFVATINRGQPNEERILCLVRNANAINVKTRGWDNTAATDHGVGEQLEHTDSATEFDEANAHITATEAHGVSGGFVDLDSAQTLKNKSISGSENTLSNIPIDAVLGLTGLVLPFAGVAAPTGWLLCNGAAISRSTYARLFAIIGTVYGAGDGTNTFNLPDLRGRVPVGAGQGSGLANRTLGAYGGEENHALSWVETGSHYHNLSNVSAHDTNHYHSGTTLGPNADHAHSTPNHQHAISGNFNPAASSPFTRVEAGTDPGSGDGNVSTMNGGGGTTGGINAHHGHGFDTGYMNANNSHNHTGSTDMQGSSTGHNTMQPYAVLNYVVKT